MHLQYAYVSLPSIFFGLDGTPILEVYWSPALASTCLQLMLHLLRRDSQFRFDSMNEPPVWNQGAGLALPYSIQYVMWLKYNLIKWSPWYYRYVNIFMSYSEYATTCATFHHYHVKTIRNQYKSKLLKQFNEFSSYGNPCNSIYSIVKVCFYHYPSPSPG